MDKLFHSEPYKEYEKSPNKDEFLIGSHPKHHIFFNQFNKLVDMKDPLSFGFRSLYKLPEDIHYPVISEDIESKVEKYWQQGDEKSKEWGFSHLIQKTSRKYFKGHFLLHAVYFFIQVPIPLIQKKFLNWLSTEVSTLEESYHKSFIINGIMYAFGLILVYLIKCAAETTQKYYYAGMKSQAYASSQAYIANRVDNLKPGTSKYFNITKLTTMLSSDSMTMGGHTYLRVNKIVSFPFQNALFANRNIDLSIAGNNLHDDAL